MKLNPKNCELFWHRVKFLGHVVREEGVATDPEKVVVVTNWLLAQNVKDVRSFHGLYTYYQQFVPSFAGVAFPLHKLTEKGQLFTRTKECDSSFYFLKDTLASTLVLAYPESEDPFVLDTDASNIGIGAVLSEVHQLYHHLIDYKPSNLNLSLVTEQHNYATRSASLQHLNPESFRINITIFSNYFRMLPFE